jgi:8-oxo-dGTP pyrophosphatase MutT (NUDIX family)
LQISKKKSKKKKIKYLLLIMKKKIGAGILAINKRDGKLLLDKRGEGGSCSNCWALFGGTFEEKDINPKTTAKREFYEETKIINNYTISKEPFYISTNPLWDFYIYLGIFEEKPSVNISDESLDYGWFTINQLPKNLHPGVQELFDKKYDILKKLINELQIN